MLGLGRGECYSESRWPSYVGFSFFLIYFFVLGHFILHVFLQKGG